MTDVTENAQEVVEPVLYRFANTDSPHLDTLLVMFYEGAYNNSIGIMEAFDLRTNEEVNLLVGVAVGEDGKPVCFPVAQLLKAEDVPHFLSPDGKGGWYDPADPVEAEAAREHLQPIVDAVGDFIQ